MRPSDGGALSTPPDNDHAAADIAPSARIGVRSKVWPLTQIRENAVVGDECLIGRGVYIGVGVHIGSRCKIQNGAMIYEPAILADGVFVGPNAVLTNDVYPRAITPQGALKGAADWQPVGTRVEVGASIGAGAVCVAPLHVGAWAVIGAGAVVVDDVPAQALVVGTPARRIGWVGRSGVRLVPDDEGSWRCPVTQEIYSESGGALRLQPPAQSDVHTAGGGL